MQSRVTKYATATIGFLEKYGHGTNAEILAWLRKDFPTVSATTIHRSTTRLALQGKISQAPVAPDGSMRYDIKTSPHDHFICATCGGIRDIDIADELIPRISNALGGCRITGRLIIQGSCEKCDISKNTSLKEKEIEL